jgi:pimeloyl-ACP methyl ester carboxylesterase
VSGHTSTKEAPITTLIAVVFDDPYKVEKVCTAVHRMARESLLEIYDRVHITKSRDSKIHIVQEDRSIVKAQEEGLRDGAAVHVGERRLPFVARRLLSKMRDHCVTLKFISHVSREVAPGNSALILLARCDSERRYTLYMQDYGGPVGFRMALAHPDRIEALIVQDAVAHNDGLGVNWKTRRAFWADRAPNESALRTNLLSLAATRTRHVGDDPNVESYDPDLWTDEFHFLNQPGQADIQSDLFYDYRTNVDAYPKWQAWMRQRQPRLLVIWGEHDLSFDSGEPERYRKDVPKAKVHVLDAGHFALDTAADEIAALVKGFVGSSSAEFVTRRAVSKLLQTLSMQQSTTSKPSMF